MSIDTVIEDARWHGVDLSRLAGRAADATLAHLGLDTAQWEIALLGCDDARIAALNSDFRDKQTATNVLSWPSEDRAAECDGDMPGPPTGPDTELGDIAIAYDTCATEARDMAKPLADHVTHLVVHGVLHLLGFDHVRNADAALMEGIESEILGRLGLDDPYM